MGPIWSEIYVYWKRRILEKRKLLVPLRDVVADIRNEIDKLLDERMEAEEDGETKQEQGIELEYLNTKLLLKVCPDMRQSQAEELLYDFCEVYYNQEFKGSTPEQVEDYMASLSHALRAWEVEAFKHPEDVGDNQFANP